MVCFGVFDTLSDPDSDSSVIGEVFPNFFSILADVSDNCFKSGIVFLGDFVEIVLVIEVEVVVALAGWVAVLAISGIVDILCERIVVIGGVEPALRRISISVVFSKFEEAEFTITVLVEAVIILLDTAVIVEVFGREFTVLNVSGNCLKSRIPDTDAAAEFVVISL